MIAGDTHCNPVSVSLLKLPDSAGFLQVPSQRENLPDTGAVPRLHTLKPTKPSGSH